MSAFRRDFVHGDATVSVSLRRAGDRRYQVQVGDRLHEVDAVLLPDGRVRCTLDGRTFEADCAPCGKTVQVRLRGRTWQLTPAEGRRSQGEATSGVIEAPMSGTIEKVLVRRGDTVEPGEPIVVLTAMKMEHRLTAGVAGVVAELDATEGETVDQGAVLARIEPA